MQRLADDGGGAGIDAPGRLADHQHAGLAQDFAADDEFLQVAAGEADRLRIALGLAHVEGLGGLVDGRQRRRLVDEAALDHAARRVAGEQRIFRQLHARRGAVAEPLFRNEGGAELAPLGDRHEPGRLAVDDDIAFGRREPLAGQRREQFVLAVAGDAGDAEDFAALDLERNVVQVHAVRIVGRQATARG